MEERYLNMHRHSEEPPRKHREEDWDEPPRHRPPSRLAKRPGKPRNTAVSVLMGFYKVLVVLSVLIVAGYAGFKVLVRPPEQAPVATPPAQNGDKVIASSSGGGAASTATPSGEAPAVRQPRTGVYNIFLAATDLEGYRTDTMMVMQYDTVEQTVGVVSVPRDTLVARAKGTNPHLVYGKGGVEERVEDVSNMLGIPIDYYIKVNIKGFISLVDQLKGIDFYVPCNMNYDDPYQDLHIHYKKGQHHLSGQQAMEVARFRKNNDGSGYSDIGRTETQQKLLIALAKKVLSWNSLTKINSFVETFNKNVTTDLSLSDMLYFASQAINLDPSTGVETATLPGRGDGVYHGSSYCYELDPEGTLDIVNRLINPYDEALSLSDMNLAKAESYR